MLKTLNTDGLHGIDSLVDIWFDIVNVKEEGYENIINIVYADNESI